MAQAPEPAAHLSTNSRPRNSRDLVYYRRASGIATIIRVAREVWFRKRRTYVYNAARAVLQTSRDTDARIASFRDFRRARHRNAFDDVSFREAADSHAEQRADSRCAEGQAGHRRIVGSA